MVIIMITVQHAVMCSNNFHAGMSVWRFLVLPFLDITKPHERVELCKELNKKSTTFQHRNSVSTAYSAQKLRHKARNTQRTIVLAQHLP